MTSPFLRVRRLVPEAVLPARASAGAAGYDLACSAPFFLPGWGQAVAPTGLAIGVPPGHYGRVAERSGLALRSGVGVGGGVIDADYTGEVRVILYNRGGDPVHFRAGDRVAQLIIEACATPCVLEVADLGVTGRGGAGFGSTGGAPLAGARGGARPSVDGSSSTGGNLACSWGGRFEDVAAAVFEANFGTHPPADGSSSTGDAHPPADGSGLTGDARLAGPCSTGDTPPPAKESSCVVEVRPLRRDALHVRICLECSRLRVFSPDVALRVNPPPGGQTVQAGFALKLSPGFVGVMRKACHDPWPELAVRTTFVVDSSELFFHYEPGMPDAPGVIYPAGAVLAEIELMREDDPARACTAVLTYDHSWLCE